jgi:hypothetical protein
MVPVIQPAPGRQRACIAPATSGGVVRRPDGFFRAAPVLHQILRPVDQTVRHHSERHVHLPLGDRVFTDERLQGICHPGRHQSNRRG